jgi:predicted acylesterase/phospholipase RssA
LKEVYTDVSEADIMVSRGALTALFGDSLYDSSPLRRLVRKFLTPELVAALGHEYSEKGRLLLVATTDLDVPVGVLWNLGAIAATARPDATDLMVDILVASASIPGIFPPVMINLEVDGKPYQEMHVDGGTVAQVVLYPPSLRVDIPNPVIQRRIENRKRSLYIIRNSRLGASNQTVDRSTFKIAERALATLIANQGIGDLYELYMLCQRDRIDYNVAIIPERFTAKPDGMFDKAYMNALFDLARGEMAAGRAWSHYPPGFNPTPLIGTTRATVQN